MDFQFGAVNFNFPRSIFTERNSCGQQLDHVMSEVDEVKEAFLDESRLFEQCVMEIADLTHSLETYWRMLADQRGDDYVERIFDQVIKKNRDRGYYDLEEDEAV